MADLHGLARAVTDQSTLITDTDTDPDVDVAELGTGSLDVQHAIKAVLNPRNILNPGRGI